MSAALIEAVPVGELELQLGHVPPCGAFINGWPCGKPSAVRVTVSCPCGGPSVTLFMCDGCFTALRDGQAHHRTPVGCNRTDLTWQET